MMYHQQSIYSSCFKSRIYKQAPCTSYPLTNYTNKIKVNTLSDSCYLSIDLNIILIQNEIFQTYLLSLLKIKLSNTFQRELQGRISLLKPEYMHYLIILLCS